MVRHASISDDGILGPFSRLALTTRRTRAVATGRCITVRVPVAVVATVIAAVAIITPTTVIAATVISAATAITATVVAAIIVGITLRLWISIREC